ncbi:MAG: HAD hydrolase family protein [Candidatus Galacturonibacter soehngenii]|nr:HAD hydrolase family protein [Candidatus Galacturonibacter soehngenii]
MANNLENIKYIVIDVDGTMTDAGIYYDELGNELKKFCTKDAAGYFAAHAVGIEIIVLTGRECKAVIRRMEEMGIKHIYQNVKEKKEFLQDFIEHNNIDKNELAYIGDDLNDYESMHLAGFIGCPKDSCEEILAISDFVSEKKGGYGAVRDVISFILKQRGQWENAIRSVYGISEIR